MWRTTCTVNEKKNVRTEMNANEPKECTTIYWRSFYSFISHWVELAACRCFCFVLLRDFYSDLLPSANKPKICWKNAQQLRRGCVRCVFVWTVRMLLFRFYHFIVHAGPCPMVTSVCTAFWRKRNKNYSVDWMRSYKSYKLMDEKTHQKSCEFGMVKSVKCDFFRRNINNRKYNWKVKWRKWFILPAQIPKRCEIVTRICH